MIAVRVEKHRNCKHNFVVPSNPQAQLMSLRSVAIQYSHIEK